MRDPYQTLGLPKDSTPEALRARYEELRAQYGEDRFREGAAGNEGARRLSELEADWKQIEQDIRQAEIKSEYGDAYGKVEAAIKEGKYEEAQKALYEITEHDGKWHYYQSIIFYKREWLSESRSQLLIAIQMEPTNMKYQEALRRMDQIMGNAGVNPEEVGRSQQGPYETPYNQQQYAQQQATNEANACANCMLCWCLNEACCTMCRMCG